MFEKFGTRSPDSQDRDDLSYYLQHGNTVHRLREY